VTKWVATSLVPATAVRNTKTVACVTVESPEL
jgi:hypothetical protein